MDILKFPLVKITIWLILGIIVSKYLKPECRATIILVFISLVVAVVAFVLARNNFRQKAYFGIVFYFLSFFTGMATQAIHGNYFRKSHYIHSLANENESHLLTVTLREKLKQTVHSERYIALVTQIDGHPASGKILLSFYNIMRGANLRIGAILVVKGHVTKHKPPLNPDQFDYGKYLDNKGIPAQMYAGSTEFINSSTLEKDIWFYSDHSRNKIIRNLKRSGFRDEELQVVNALILGQQQEISADVMRDYQYAGAVHILSVSGLHVGFILLFLNFLLKPLPKNRSGRIIKLILIISSLWTFAIVAGLSPSVVRSVTMFSFLALGMYLKRSTNIFHTLIVSALLILLFEPSFLFDVGFQLSYVALFFILWLQPLLSDIWIPQNPIIKYFWDILTVSFAAQIGAFPLSTYYFHQFPGLFFVTNLVIIPFLSVIMLLGVVVMAMAAFDFVPQLLSKGLEWSIFILDRTINTIASFEKFIIRDIPLNFGILTGLYLVIVGAIIWFKKPSFPKMTVALLTVMILQCILFANKWQMEKEQELIVFNMKKNTVIAERHGQDITLYSNKGFERKIEKDKTLVSYMTANFCKVRNKQPLKNTMFFDQNKILILDSTAICPPQCNAGIVLLTHSPKINLDRYIKDCRPAIVVADASNFKSYAKAWEQTCLKAKIPFHYTCERGFFRLRK